MLGQLIGSGAQAEIYEWDAGRVIKLFRPDYVSRAYHEAAAAAAVHRAGVRCPAVFEVAECMDRTGVVFERADGPTLNEELWAGRRTPREVGELIADLHLEMHRHSADLKPLPSTYLGYTLAAGTTIFHGDFHPGNVILSARGPLIIDWVNGRNGTPVADVAAAFVSMRHHPLAEPVDGGVNHLVLDVMAEVAETYLARYRMGTADPLDDLPHYLAVFAANTVHLYPDHPERGELEELSLGGRRS